MKYILPLMTIMFSAAALAASSAHGDEHAIPTTLIRNQAINVVLMVVGLAYFLKDPVRKFFAEKRASFLSAAQKAEAARKAAEDERAQIQARLNKLESTAEESVNRARAEAADMKKQLIAEAEALSKRVRQEAEESARIEVTKAKAQLRETLVKESLEMAKAQLVSKVTPEDHKRLQTEFISNIQAVQK